MTHQTKKLRTFLQRSLNDTQLRTFVLDHFPELYGQISAWGQSYTDRILMLIDFCYRLGILDAFEEKLAADFQEQLTRFEEMFDEFEEDTQRPNPSSEDQEMPRLDIPPPDSWN